MDEMRKVARAYYNGAAGSEKELARKLFRSLDVNGDGKVSLREYKKALKLNNASFSNNDFFKELDSNCNGTLDFDEVLALYYMDKVSLPSCRSCKSLLVDSYFSCLPCQADVSYYLCCDCYGGGKFKHHHSSNKFIDTRAMLKLLDQILKQSQITNQQTDEVDLLQGDDQGMALEEEEEEEDGEEDVAEEEDDDDDGEEEEDDVDEDVAEEEDDDNDDGEEKEDDDDDGEVDGAKEEDDGEEDVAEEEDDEEEEDGDDEEVVNEVGECDDPNPNVNIMDGKAVKKNRQLQSKKSNRSQKEKIVKILEAMNTAVSIGSAVVNLGDIATTSCCIM